MTTTPPSKPALFVQSIPRGLQHFRSVTVTEISLTSITGTWPHIETAAGKIEVEGRGSVDWTAEPQDNSLKVKFEGVIETYDTGLLRGTIVDIIDVAAKLHLD